MTDEMLALARENQRKAGVENVEWLRGEIEAIPLPAESVDVVISNCVINLSGDKRQVLAVTPGRGPGGRRDHRDPPGPRQRRLGDRPRPQAELGPQRTNRPRA